VHLPRVGDAPKTYGDNAVALSQQHQTAEVVNFVTYDLRGFDTLGEELILFTAAIGSAVLLRASRSERRAATAAEREQERGPRTADALRAFGAALVGPFVLIGLYVVVHGNLTPGGGFQGGVILAGALLLVYAAGQTLAVQRLRPIALVEVAEAVGALGYALVGLGGLIAAGAFLDNFLPLGTSGALLSGGTVPLLSIVVGLEVAGAITLVLSEFLDQQLLAEGER
jgi:multicomponent Na+:H+ antiporter subunit B